MEKKEDAAREAQNQYMREWRQRNPDKVREISRRYWQRRAERLASGEGGEKNENKDS